MRIDARTGLAAGAILAAACLEPLDPADLAIETVKVSIGETGRQADTIQVRRTTRVSAVAIAPQGYDLGPVGFRFASSDSVVASVDSLGVVRGIGPGQASISAIAPRGQSASATVVVVPTTIAYTIPVGRRPVAMTVGPDLSLAYVSMGPDSIAVMDAVAFTRLFAVAVPGRAPATALAASATELYAVHPGTDSISVISTAGPAVTRHIVVGQRPTGVAAAGARVYLGAGDDERVVVLERGAPAGTIGLPGKPEDLAVSLDGARLFATIRRGADWELAVISTAAGRVTGTIPLPGEPRGLTANAAGSRVYALIPSLQTAIAFRITEPGEPQRAGSVDTGAHPGGISAKPVGPAYVVVSGEPAVIFDGESLRVLDRVAGAGTGAVTIRPDGFFAFIAVPDGKTIHVVRL